VKPLTKTDLQELITSHPEQLKENKRRIRKFRDESENSALYVACEKSSGATDETIGIIIDILYPEELTRAAELFDLRNNKKCPLLHYVVKYGDPQKLPVLIKSLGDLATNALKLNDEFGQDIFFLLTTYCEPQILKEVLLKPIQNTSLFHIMVRNYDYATISHAISKLTPAIAAQAFFATDGFNRPALCDVLLHGDEITVQQVLELLNDPDLSAAKASLLAQYKNHEMNLLFYAIHSGKLAIVNQVISYVGGEETAKQMVSSLQIRDYLLLFGKIIYERGPDQENTQAMMKKFLKLLGDRTPDILLSKFEEIIPRDQQLASGIPFLQYLILRFRNLPYLIEEIEFELRSTSEIFQHAIIKMCLKSLVLIKNADKYPRLERIQQIAKNSAIISAILLEIIKEELLPPLVQGRELLLQQQELCVIYREQIMEEVCTQLLTSYGNDLKKLSEALDQNTPLGKILQPKAGAIINKIFAYIGTISDASQIEQELTKLAGIADLAKQFQSCSLAPSAKQACLLKIENFLQSLAAIESRTDQQEQIYRQWHETFLKYFLGQPRDPYDLPMLRKAATFFSPHDGKILAQIRRLEQLEQMEKIEPNGTPLNMLSH